LTLRPEKKQLVLLAGLVVDPVSRDQEVVLMGDALVALPTATADGATWFAANSHGDPSDAQVVEHIARVRPRGGEVRCTDLVIPQVRETFEVVLSRPFWTWGASMGVNERGVAMSVHDVVARPRAAAVLQAGGLQGEDLLRLALERASSAREAIDVVTALMHEHGVVPHRVLLRARAWPAFLIADAGEAWVLETAGVHWAAKRVRGTRAQSEVFTIGDDAELLSSDVARFAVREGLRKPRGAFRLPNTLHFAATFGDAGRARLLGAPARRVESARRIAEARGAVRFSTMASALRDHAGHAPEDGVTRNMLCQHASFWPTRVHGQTTGSFIARMTARGVVAWASGTSSPCLSVMKPVELCVGATLDAGPRPRGRYDDDTLYWRHELVHRHVLLTSSARFASIQASSRDLERSWTHDDGRLVGRDFQAAWDAHRSVLDEWAQPILSLPAREMGLFARYWRAESLKDRVPSPTSSRAWLAELGRG
jgi:dipeptidase